MTAKRTEIRVCIVQTLFSNEFRNFRKKMESEKLRELYAGITSAYGPSFINDPFALRVLDMLPSKIDEIDAMIAKTVKNWDLSTMGTLDKNILRLGVFEIFFNFSVGVPGPVALNEAVELGKMFLSDGGGKFINGVLGAIYEEAKNTLPAVKNEEKQKERMVGTLIYHFHDKHTPLFVFVRDVFGKWTLPRGNVEKEEEPMDALTRIIKEKTNLTATITDSIGLNSHVSYPPEGPTRKEIAYFLAETDDRAAKLNGRTSGPRDVQWFTAEEIKHLELYKDMRPLIAQAVERVERKHGT